MNVGLFRRYYEEQEKETPIPAPTEADEADITAEEKKAEPKRQRKTTKK